MSGLVHLSYSNRHADLLFELINRRHEQKSTLVTTNKSFAEWLDVFPNAAFLKSFCPRQTTVKMARVEEAEGDEMRSFVGSKSRQHWLWHAIDHASGKVLAYVFGRRKNTVYSLYF